MSYFIDDSAGALFWYDCDDQAVSGLRGPVTDDEVYSIQNLPLPPNQLLLVNQGLKHERLLLASQIMAPLLVSLQLGNATDEEIQAAKAWQSYCRALTSIDITTSNPDWPIPPQ